MISFNLYFGLMYLYYVICQNIAFWVHSLSEIINSWEIWIVVRWWCNLILAFSWRHVRTPSLMTWEAQMHACLMSEHFQLCLISQLKVSWYCVLSPYIFAWGSMLLMPKLPAELAGASIELRHRLIPEHARNWIFYQTWWSHL